MQIAETLAFVSVFQFSKITSFAGPSCKKLHFVIQYSQENPMATQPQSPSVISPSDSLSSPAEASPLEMEGLFHAAQAILDAPSTADICLKLTAHFNALVHADRTVIFLVDHEQRQIQLAVYDGHIVDDLDTTYEELCQGLSGIVFHNKKPVLSLSPEDGIEPKETQLRRKQAGTGAVIVVPLVTRDKVIGTITALNRAHQRAFTQHDVDLLMSLAMQAATAIENARMLEAEQDRRRIAEALLQAGRKLSGSITLSEVPGRILEQLSMVVSFERGSLMLREGDMLRIVAQRGFPNDERAKEIRMPIREGDVFQRVENAAHPVLIHNVLKEPGWQQVEWLPLNLSWMGVPLFSKDQVIGMISLTRREASAFSSDDSVLASTFALQAAIALENAGLYEEITRFNEQLEQMVQQRTEELKQALHTLERLDKNKSDFIGVAAHELRTPLTVMKGYIGMMESEPSIKGSPYLSKSVTGVLKGIERLHEIVNSMLDVVRIENQILDLHTETIALATIVKRVRADLEEVLAERKLSFNVGDLNHLPHIQGDATLLLKVFQNVIVNALKYTPDGGRITISGKKVTDQILGNCVEIQVLDTGIGIDPEHLELIFEKFYQTGESALHSTGKTTFKGGGPGLGLSIARGVVEAHGGRIWAESAGQDEAACPGSCFHILLPVTGGASHG
jgi:signal transduction histidine kinase